MDKPHVGQFRGLPSPRGHAEGGGEWVTTSKYVTRLLPSTEEEGRGVSTAQSCMETAKC